MSHDASADASFFKGLIEIDEGLVAHVQRSGCERCGARLDRADYIRKPRGLPIVDERFAVRFSLCCSREGCRARRLPPSVRFLGRRVYVAIIVLLASARAVLAPDVRVDDVPRRTLRRWIAWWQSTFIASAFFVTSAPRFMPPLDVATMPASLIARMPGESESGRVAGALRWLAPFGSSFPRVQ